MVQKIGNGAMILHCLVPIDLSSADSIFLKFECQYYYFHPNSQVLVGFSTNGTDFNYLTVLENTPRKDNSTPVETVAIQLPEISNEPQVWIQFRWVGEWEYNLKIDDVALSVEDPTPPISYGFTNYLYYPPASYAQPVDLLMPDSLRFAADIKNDGRNDILNTVLKAEVLDESNNSVFADSILIDTFYSGTTLEFNFPARWGPENLEVGRYMVNYEVYSLEAPDPDLFNNSWSRDFLVTENLYSKEEEPNVSGRPGIGGDYFCANLYETSDNLLPESIYFEDITFTSSVSPNDPPIEGNDIIVWVGKILDDVIGTGWDSFDIETTLIENSGIEVISFQQHFFEGEPFDLQTLTVRDFQNQPIFMEPGTRYFVGTLYQGESNYIRQAFSDKIDYYQTSTVIYSSQWFLGGFGRDRAATIRLSTTTEPVSNVEEELSDESIQVFPNPTTDKLTLKLPTDNTKPFSVYFADINGQIIEKREIEKFESGYHTFDVSHFPSGNYFVRLVTEDGGKTVKFNISR